MGSADASGKKHFTDEKRGEAKLLATMKNRAFKKDLSLRHIQEKELQ